MYEADNGVMGGGVTIYIYTYYIPWLCGLQGASLNEELHCRPLQCGTHGGEVKMKKSNGDHWMVERREGVTSDQCTIGSQVTKCAWSPTPVTQNWCVPFVVACDPIRARSIIFEGSLAEKLGFWVSKLHFWRKSRTKASFLSFEASFLKEVSQKSFVLELRTSIFEGSLAEKL